MEQCKWSFKMFGKYIQFTESNWLKIVSQNKEKQWFVKMLIQICFVNCWKGISKNGGGLMFAKIGFTNNECEGKSIYFTILNFGLWCRW
jgi:hypothetical protein